MNLEKLTEDEAWAKIAPYVERLASQLNPREVKSLYRLRNMTLEKIAKKFLPENWRIDIRKRAVYAIVRAHLDESERRELARIKEGYGGKTAMQNRRDAEQFYNYQSAAGKKAAEKKWSEDGKEAIAINNLLYSNIDLGVLVALYRTSKEKKDKFDAPMPVSEIARFFDCSVSAITPNLQKAVEYNILTSEQHQAETKYRMRYNSIQNNLKRWSREKLDEEKGKNKNANCI